jgi:hypothetical protein
MVQGQGTIYTKTQYAAETSAYGTEGTSYSELPRVQSCVLNPQNGFIYDRGMGEGLNASNTYYGQFTATGSVAFDVVDFDFLKNWVGHKTGAGSSGDPYILTEASTIEAASAAATKLIPFSIETLNDDGVDTVELGTGCVGTTFSLSGEINQKLSCTANFVAQKTKYRSSGESYTPVTDAAFTMINGTWKWGATPTALAGVQSFTINYDNGLVVDTRTIESRFITIPRMGQRSYKFSISIIMASTLATTIINDFYGSESGGTYSPEDGSTAISPTSSLEFEVELVNGSNYANLQLDECSIDQISKPASLGGGLVRLAIEGTAREGLGNVPIKWWTV